MVTEIKLNNRHYIYKRLISKNYCVMKQISLSSEFKYLEKVQLRCIALSNYLESFDPGHYDDYIIKLSSIVGAIEDLLSIDEI